MTGAIIISWGSPAYGREEKALGVFSNALSYFEGLAKQGRIHGHREFVMLTGNVSERGGTQIVDGDLDELTKIQTEEDFRRLVAQATSVVQNLTVQLAVGGTDQAIQNEMTLYVETLQNLGMM